MILGWMVGGLHGYADDASHIVQKFNGTSATNTAPFTVGDKWEIIWDSPMPLRITLLSPDGTLVAGTAGVFRGSLYQPKGGSYYLQIEGATNSAMAPWHVSVVEIGATPANSATSASGAYSIPSSLLPPGSPTSPSGQPTSAEPSAVAATSTPATNAPSAHAPSAPIVKLTEDQTRAVVVIKGDNAEGSGFLIKTPDGPAVVTNIHVISNNPNIKILTSTGAEIPMVSLKGASDRDLVLFAIKDANYSYLDWATDVSSTVQSGDDVVTPGNSEGGEVTVNTGGKVIGIGPQRVEFDNPIYHGNSGGPVFHTKSGKVIGVVTEVTKVDTSDELDKASFANPNSALGHTMRYFGLRLDTVPKWEPYDWKQLQTETTFLEEFHQQSKCLDSYLNAKEGTPEARLYLTDEKLRTAEENFEQQAAGGDSSQRLDALRQLLFDLNGIADTNMAAIQDSNNFYAFDRQQASDEANYRMNLKKQLDFFGSDISRLSSVARKSN